MEMKKVLPLKLWRRPVTKASNRQDKDHHKIPLADEQGPV